MSNFTARFGEVIVRSGIASIPDAVFSFQKELGLSVGECWFVAQILRFKWTTELPRPSLRKMAEYTGVSERTLHNYKNSLIGKGYLRVISRTNERGGQIANYYDFTGLFEKIISLLEEKEQETNPFEDAVEEEIQEEATEKISDPLCKNFSAPLKNFQCPSEKITEPPLKKFQTKQNNNKTEKYKTEEYINNNPPNGGTNSQPSAGVVAEINKQYKKITGRDKLSFFASLLEEYSAEKVMNAVAYLEKAMSRNKIDNPEGFIVSALKENWDTHPFEQEQKLKKEFAPPKNYFNSYTQRTYDVEELERKLLEHSMGKFLSSNNESLEDEKVLFDDS
ncbi:MULTISPECIES: hypothetical protein [Thermoanaerobacter]|jgi:hypothetical protein|uniref:DnaD N-terminal domain-containing protein n=2 Tax=Thermoanaerobacter TaxID=1754 RepID=B0KAU1_THEP3|nr:MULTISPECIES: hypothetical protein [Thermoanaerobacter]ABY93712.1 hypothetical protein Teth39_0039 [Thermoanaerobacter pseudethanolicus ATCC 33223]ADV78673.1 hypothetical protein Thebr_0041 [Thermoanaerobacter brockii subsp. finnii Ako-1]HBW60404.1 hypothetical protein [Thermoanaerobacter sp.]